jgi:hypothetical protein
VYPLIFLPPTSDGLPEREREVHVSGRLQHIWNKNGKNPEHYAGDLSSMGCQENKQEYKYYIEQNYWQEVFLLSLQNYIYRY